MQASKRERRTERVALVLSLCLFVLSVFFVVPAFAGNPNAGCHQNGQPDKNGNGANAGDNYDANCDETSSGPGGSGKDNPPNRPCDGCVGNADNKNPRGQHPNGSDPNKGYECDDNKGVGKGNPAHTGCQPTTTHDECPDIDGDQPAGTDCGGSSTHDECPDIDGDQPAGTDCGGSTNNPPDPDPTEDPVEPDPTDDPTVRPTIIRRPGTPHKRPPAVAGKRVQNAGPRVKAGRAAKAGALPFTGPETIWLGLAGMFTSTGSGILVLARRRRDEE